MTIPSRATVTNGPTTGIKFDMVAKRERENGYLTSKRSNVQGMSAPTNKELKSLEANHPETFFCVLLQRFKAMPSCSFGKRNEIERSTDFSSRERNMAMLNTNMAESIPPRTARSPERIFDAAFCALSPRAERTSWMPENASMPNPFNVGAAVCKY